jgi:hypothetical protein
LGPNNEAVAATVLARVGNIPILDLNVLVQIGDDRRPILSPDRFKRAAHYFKVLVRHRR